MPKTFSDMKKESKKVTEKTTKDLTDLVESKKPLTSIGTKPEKEIVRPVKPPTTADIEERDERRKEELDKAAKLILEVLFPLAAETILLAATKDFRIPVWQYIAGVLLRTFNDGRLGAYTVDDAWNTPHYGKSNQICEICGKDFVPTRTGQRVCLGRCATKFAEKIRQEGEANRRR